MKLKCPNNDKHDGFVQTYKQLITNFIDADGNRYSFPSCTVEKGRIFCVFCQAEAVEVDEYEVSQQDN
jgi:hypothetical protein